MEYKSSTTCLVFRVRVPSVAGAESDSVMPQHRAGHGHGELTDTIVFTTVSSNASSDSSESGLTRHHDVPLRTPTSDASVLSRNLRGRIPQRDVSPGLSSSLSQARGSPQEGIQTK
eukprot:3607096-Rhodomonas_salina.1